MKAIWTGTIGFGLVNIPVKMFSAVQSSDLDLDMLDKKDHSNIHFKRVNAETGREVPWKDIVRGYKLNDRYVVLNEADFEKASPEKTKTIEISQFIDENQVEPVYYETSYFLEPEKSGTRAYVLLRESLKKTGKAAFGSYVLRSKQSLCIIKPLGDLLILYKIRFKEEIRSGKDIKVPSAAPKPAEMKMAIQLIKQLSGKFDITRYKDSYSAELMKLIRARANGKNPKAPHLKVVHSTTKDLMSQLKASLGSKNKKAS